MKQLLAISLLFLSVLAHAQFVTVQGTVKDSYGTPYSNGTGVVVLQPGSVQWLYGNSPVTTTVPIGSLDSFGHFSVQLMNTSVIQPQSQSPVWSFSFSSATCAAQPIPASFTMTGIAITANTDITASIPAQAAVNNCTGGGGSGITITTVAGLATVPNKRNGTLAVVTDGASASDCSTGGGSTNVLCQYDGTTWSALWLPLAGGTMTGVIVGNVAYDSDAYGPTTGGLSFVDSYGNVLGIGQSSGNNFIEFATAGQTTILGDDLNGILFHVFGSVFPGTMSMSPTHGIVLQPPQAAGGSYRLPVTIDINALQPFANNTTALCCSHFY